jgi:hypothetical protein
MSEVMSSLTKIILGIVVLVIVVGGLYLIFKSNVIDFFKNMMS